MSAEVGKHEKALCFFCGKDSGKAELKKCGHCPSFACDGSHLSMHRPPGAEACLPVRVRVDEGEGGRGRFLVAERRIEDGEVVLLDSAVVVAPDATPLCLVCYKDLDLEEEATGCFRCGVPLCGDGGCLEAAPASDHAQLECAFLAGSDAVQNIFKNAAENRPRKKGERNFAHCQLRFLYTCIGFMRVILTWKTGRIGRSVEIGQLQTHADERKSDEHVSKALSSAATFLGRLDLGLSSDVDVEDLVRHAHGALRTNAIGFHGLSSSALYPLVAKASHSCLPNMEPLPQVGRRFGFAAKTRIEEGEELTIRYRGTISHRLELRSDLRRQWFFDCGCVRCRDRTDGGTFMSSIACPECREGWLVPEKPLDLESDWICHRSITSNSSSNNKNDGCDSNGNSNASELCLGRVGKEHISMLDVTSLKIAQEAEEGLAGKMKALEVLERKLKLHPNYHAILKVKQSFLDEWEGTGISDGGTDEAAARFCSDLLRVYEVADPGRTQAKGRLRRLRLRAAAKVLMTKKMMGAEKT